MREIREIIIHCSATAPDWMAGYHVADKVAEIWRWHKARGWRAIGYHYIIDRDGEIAPGRPVEQIGAHVRGHNRYSIGVCLLGARGASATDKFEHHFTPAQAVALDKLLADLKAQFGDVKVSGHNEYANKGCPGFHVPTYFANRFAIDEPVAPPVEKEGGGFLTAIIAAILGLFGK